jgi:hypothetical protein
MKTVFIVISKDVIRRNILETDFWTSLTNSNTEGTKFVLVVEEGKKQYFEEHFVTSSNVVVAEYDKSEFRGKFEKIILFLMRNGIQSDSMKLFRKRAALSGRASLVTTYTKAFLSELFGRLNIYKKLLRRLLLTVSPSHGIATLFDKHNPTHVFTPSMIDNDFDIRIAIESKRRNIPLLGMVRSWDNLNNHGLLALVPDVFYFQNIFLEEMAEKFQAISLKRIQHKRVGLPHYDLYKHLDSHIKPKEIFEKEVGIDPGKTLVFFGGSDVFIDEADIPHTLNKAIEEGAIQNAQIWYRPHPSSSVDIESVRKLSHVIVDDVFKRSQEGGAAFSDTDRFINILHHSSVIINVASTLSIDAAVFDKPAVCIDYDGEANNQPYWNSVHVLYKHWDHYQRLMSTGGAEQATSAEELIKMVNEAIENPQKGAAGRKKIIETFVDTFDGKSGKRLADLLTSSLN